MNIAFITRTKAENKKYLDGQDYLQDLIQTARKTKVFNVIYIVANFEDKNYKPSKNSTPIIVVKVDNPTGPISINTVINRNDFKEKHSGAFLVCSKEVMLEKNHIKELIKKIQKNNLLVVGYKFHIVDKTGRTNDILNNELQGYYANKNLIAYKVPWNTCAIWRSDLFNTYVTKFDEITARNPFSQIGVSIDGICSKTDHQGMEDGLAIAEAVSRRNKKIKYKLLKRPLLNCEVNNNDNEIKKHRQKLARKDTVLRNFMAVRNYSVSDLESAGI